MTMRRRRHRFWLGEVNVPALARPSKRRVRPPTAVSCATRRSAALESRATLPAGRCCGRAARGPARPASSPRPGALGDSTLRTRDEYRGRRPLQEDRPAGGGARQGPHARPDQGRPGLRRRVDRGDARRAAPQRISRLRVEFESIEFNARFIATVPTGTIRSPCASSSAPASSTGRRRSTARSTSAPPTASSTSSGSSASAPATSSSSLSTTPASSSAASAPSWRRTASPPTRPAPGTPAWSPFPAAEPRSTRRQ